MYRFYVKVKESFNQMITILEEKLNKKTTNFLKSDTNKYFVDNIEMKKNSKRIWFKGSRNR